MKKCIHTKLEKLGMALKDSLLAEVSYNHKKLEEKLDQVISDNRSYADKVKVNTKASNFATIIKETKNYDLLHENQGDLRSSNRVTTEIYF